MLKYEDRQKSTMEERNEAYFEFNLSNAVMWKIYLTYPSGKVSIKTVCKGEAKQGDNYISYMYIYQDQSEFTLISLAEAIKET